MYWFEGKTALQVLDSEQLELAFQLHGVSRDTQARKFYADLWAEIKAAEKARDHLTLALHERTLRSLCHDYFSMMDEWRVEEEDRSASGNICSLSRDNAKEARAAIPFFEKQFFRYTMCYMELNRALIHAKVQIAHFTKDYEITDMEKVIEVNHGTGSLLAKAQRERKEIQEKRMRLERVRGLLQDFDPLMEKLGAELPTQLEDGDRAFTQFKGAVRKSNFVKAETLAKAWKKPKLNDVARQVVSLARKHEKELQATDGLMLHTGELTLINMFLHSDEVRINEFMAKYDVPYMVFQLKNLIHQGYLLGSIGSIEGLIIHHAKLLSVAARTHDDADYAKTQEKAVLVPTRVLLQHKFKMLGAIFDDMETTLTVMNKQFTQTREFMSLRHGAAQK